MADPSLTAVLHTWGQNLDHHPHIHRNIPGGGGAPDGGRWISCRPGFFLPVRVLSHQFRRLFLEGLVKLFEACRLCFFNDLAGLADRTAFLVQVAPLMQPSQGEGSKSCCLHASAIASMAMSMPGVSPRKRTTNWFKYPDFVEE
jgi:hypothetical protein